MPRRATVAPALRTLASTTLPKLPSPISFRTSNLSSRAIPLMIWVDPLRVKSCVTVMVCIEVDDGCVNAKLPIQWNRGRRLPCARCNSAGRLWLRCERSRERATSCYRSIQRAMYVASDATLESKCVGCCWP